MHVNSYFCTTILYINSIQWKRISMKFTFVCPCGKIEERKMCVKLKPAVMIFRGKVASFLSGTQQTLSFTYLI
jgi:hypothetical protein